MASLLLALPAGAHAADPVASVPDAQHDGASARDQAGSALADAGDVNGDGLHDALVASPLADPNGRTEAGSVSLILGGGAGAIRIHGALAGHRLGETVSGAGDVNGDGLDDVVLAAREADPSGRSNAGSVYVVFGRAGGATIDLAALGSAGFRIDGAASNDRLGSGAAALGDQNGDGLDDFALSARGSDHNGRSNSGSAYVVFGRAGSATVNVGTLGAGGYRIDGALAGDAAAAVASAGDVTGDGARDLIIGASGADPHGRTAAGSVYVVPSSAAAATIDLASSASWLARFDGAAANDGLGAGVAYGGNLDGDGALELLAGAPGADPADRSAAGSVYVLDAATGGVTDLAARLPGLRIDGPGANDSIGSALAGGRDLNSDGIADLVLGNPLDDRGGWRAGTSYVLYGGERAGVTDLAAPLGAGFRVDGAGEDRAGAAVALAGDMNGDGRPELLHGVPRFDAANGRWDAGTSWVVHGFAPARVAYPPLIEATITRSLGPVAPSVLERTSSARFSVSPPLPPGVELDPLTGVVAGTPSQLYDGSEHTIFMSDLGGTAEARITVRVEPLPGACANERPGTPGDDTLTGSRGGDKIAGGAGADALDGAGGDDCVSGDDQADRLAGGDGDDALDGGGDGDELSGGGGSDQLSGGEAADSLEGGDGSDALAGGADRDVLHGGSGGDQLRGEDSHDRLSGEDGDDALFGGVGNDELIGGAGADRLSGEGGFDVLFGNDGDDVLETGAETDRLDGGTGNDTLRPGAGADYVVDRAGSNRVTTGAGNDTVNVRNRARDVVKCGTGRDKVVADKRDRLKGCEKRKRR